jgi:hypothetical protein
MYLELVRLTEVAQGTVVISGGWAWCLMTPKHTDYKHAHDLKDIDLFVKPEAVETYIPHLYYLGYTREHTKYDRLSPFYRYSKMISGRGCSENDALNIDKKVIIDLFVKEVPSIKVEDEFWVVEPSFLSGLYGKHDPDSRLHGSGQCLSLHNSLELMSKGKEVNGNPEMADFSKWVKQ